MLGSRLWSECKAFLAYEWDQEVSATAVGACTALAGRALGW